MYAPFMDLVVSLCVVIVLSHKHSLIFLHMTNGNIFLVQTPAQLLLPMVISALCSAMHFISVFFSSMLWLCHSLFHLHHACIPEAVHLIPLITDYDSPSLPQV